MLVLGFSMIRPVNTLLFISILGISVMSVAQTDVHLVESPAKSLFHRSAWAHGYIHGYESGFHQGNLDLHMARAIQDPHSVKDYKKSGNAYHSSFGSRPEFQKGYCSGFEVGYLDGFSGREFRAASEANLMSTLVSTNEELDSNQATHLDVLLDSGYLQGRRIGLSDARARLAYRPAEVSCPDTAKTQVTCGTYQAGFRWGYSDGYSNQRADSNTQRASK
jgi:hypothetical protein